MLEGRAVQVAAGEAFVLEDEGGAGGFLAGVQRDVFPAKVDLVGRTFAFAGEFGFAGVDGGGFHGRLLYDISLIVVYHKVLPE